jgi:predicted dehydrogenase
MTSRSPLRVAIVGAGNMGTVHLGHLRTLEREGLAVPVGVADPDATKRERCAWDFNIDVFPTQAEMLQRTRATAVIIAVPNRDHVETATEALEEGKHVLLEKPPGMNVAEVRRLAEAASGAEGVLLNALVYRHMVPTAKPFVEELGDIYLGNAWWQRRRGIPGWGTYTDPELQGGGAFIDLGVHVVDLAWWLMGCPRPLRVGGSIFSHLGRRSRVGLLGTWDRNRFAVEDTATATIMFPQKAKLQAHVAFAANIPRREKAGVYLHGLDGGMKLRLMTTQTRFRKRFRPRVYSERHEILTNTKIGPPNPPTISEGYLRQLRHFVACCWGDAEPVVSLREMVELQGIIDGLYGSASSTGQVVLAEENGAADPDR